MLYARSHGRTIHLPGRLSDRLDGLQLRLYLFLINRLYLDAAALALGRIVTGAVRRLDQSRLFLALCAAVALAPLLPAAAATIRLPVADIALLLIALLTLPLFPFHGLYIVALTRVPGYLPVGLALLLPAAGFYTLQGLLPHLPPELLRGVGVSALIGALYGSLKAVAQFRVRRLIAYAGLAFHSILWWHLAAAGGDTPQAALYVSAVALVTGGLLLAWHAVQARYGNLDMDRIGGLALTMPRFALLLALLVMAAVGLPPFGLIFGFLGILFHSGIVALSGDLLIILLAWFLASWYLFKMLKRLLFGPSRADLVYEDLRGIEVVPLVLVLAALIGLGIWSMGGVTFNGPSDIRTNAKTLAPHTQTAMRTPSR
jgi:NADH-quinone oxidoreductase subunit M